MARRKRKSTRRKSPVRKDKNGCATITYRTGEKRKICWYRSGPKKGKIKSNRAA